MATLLELKNIHKTYQLGETKVPALRGVDLTVEAGEFAAIVGSSGSGKSTLLNMVGCIDTPDEGEVLLDNSNILKLSDDERSRLRNQKIGFIFQTFNLVPVLTVFENIELPLHAQANVSAAERRDRVHKLLQYVGIPEYHRHLPDKLSGGQRQRVAIARALVTFPRFVLADEPTANLDSKTAHHIIDLMLELNEKTKVTFLFSTHDEKLIHRVKRVVRLQDGQIATQD